MKYDQKKYKIRNWKSFVNLHWIINPGIAFTELVFGLTIPKVVLIEREGNKPLYQRTFVPCPHCETLHNGLKWSSQNKTIFKNWFGLYCDNCAGIIPVQRNLTSLLVLFITFPIWGWFRKSLKQYWLDIQPDRYENLNLEIPASKNKTKNWLLSGLYFGLFMYIVMELIVPLIEKKEITQKQLLIGIPIWIFCGLFWGILMKLLMNKKGK